MRQGLFDSALDIVLQSGFIVRVTIRTGEIDDDPTFYCSPDAASSDIRNLLRAKNHKHKGKELRLKDCRGNHVFGAFEKSPPSSDTLLSCEAVGTDPHLAGLFEALDMTELERDRMMSRMLKPRYPQQCPGNHGMKLSDELILTEMVCDKCQVGLETCPDWFGCRVCNYDLCRACHEHDQGGESIMIGTNPYEEVGEIAKKIGKELARGEKRRRLHKWVGRRSMILPWHTSDWGWVQPSIFKEFTRLRVSLYRFHVPRDHRLVAPGVRLVIRFNAGLRAAVWEAIGFKEGAHRVNLALLPGETDEILPAGATIEDLKKHGLKLCSKPEIWEHVTKKLSSKIARRWRWEKGLWFDLVLELVLFQLHEVTYKLSAFAAGSNVGMSVSL